MEEKVEPNYRNEDELIDAGVPYPSLCDNNKIRDIGIQEVAKGYIVVVGCSTFAIGTKEELITKLIEYINEPEKTEQKWFEGKLF